MATGFEYDESLARQQEQLAMTADMVRQRREVLDALKLAPGEHVLDVGSGNGVMVREMAGVVGPDGRSVGVDASRHMVTMASGLCAGVPNVAFELAGADALPFAEASFDKVTTAQCLCFLADVDTALGEMHRVLKPGGRLVILDTDWGSLVWNSSDQDLMAKLMRWYTSAYKNAHLPRTLSRRLNEAGFRVSDRTSFVILNWQQDPHSYAGQQMAFLISMAQSSDQVSDAEVKAWLKDLEATDKAGDWFFSLSRYIFCAAKP